MLNRKESKSNGSNNRSRVVKRSPAPKTPRRRFIISAKAAAANHVAPHQPQNGNAKHPAPPVKPLPPGAKPAVPGPPGPPVDLAETIKTLLHLAHENGHVTYD